MYYTLKNPRLPMYKEMKDYIKRHEFQWCYEGQSIANKKFRDDQYLDAPFYSHTFLARPEKNKYSKSDSKHTDDVIRTLEEILEHNKNWLPISYDRHFWLRINANCTHPNTGVQVSMPHTDHGFDYWSMIVYLTNTDGNTIIDGEEVEPEEDKVILFPGCMHHMRLPTHDRRIIIVGTLFDEG